MRQDVIHTRIWLEDPEPDNPFAARTAYCHGFDVYGDMLGQARWVEMLYLLFRGETPSTERADLLESLAVALANPGPRDPSVHAAMCGGVCGSPAASSLIAALAVGAGQLCGGREILVAMEGWKACGTNLESWREWLPIPTVHPGNIWPQPEHPPGFDPGGVSMTTVVRQTLSCLARYDCGRQLSWLETNIALIEHLAGCPLALSGVAAAALSDLGFEPQEGELLYLLLRLPGAAAHALEQRAHGHKKFPFGTLELVDTHGDVQHD